MLYEVALTLHLTCFAGWSALTLGGYYVLRRARSIDALKAYYDLVKLEILAAICLPATGLAMSLLRWGFQPWIRSALAVSALVGLLEILHIYIARRAVLGGSIEFLVRGVDRLAIPFTISYVVMIYLMVFKP